MVPELIGQRVTSAELLGPILLVEDDPGDALLVEELLADSGLDTQLRWVRSLAEALGVLSTQPQQCVLLDLHLPDTHGMSALDSVLAVAGDAAVVVLTGLAEEQAGLAAVASGAQDYLIKGRVESDLLGRAVRYAVHRKQADRAAGALQIERLRAQENARLERGLLPVPLLGAAPVAVTARYRPSRTAALLGGDFYDVVEADDGTVHAVIGDVSGHGPDEAALGVCLRIAWRTLVLSGVSGPRLLRQLERILVAERSSPEIFATVCTLALLPDRRTVRVLRAGHPGFLVRSPQGVEHADPAYGPALGLLPGVQWAQDELQLPPGGALVLYTDGLFEGRLTDTDATRLGEEGLTALARQRVGLPAAAFLDLLLADVEAATIRGGRSADDIAVVHVEWIEGQ